MLHCVVAAILIRFVSFICISRERERGAQFSTHSTQQQEHNGNMRYNTNRRRRRRSERYLYGLGALWHVLEKALEQVGDANVGAGDDAHLELDVAQYLLKLGLAVATRGATRLAAVAVTVATAATAAAATATTSTQLSGDMRCGLIVSLVALVVKQFATIGWQRHRATLIQWCCCTAVAVAAAAVARCRRVVTKSAVCGAYVALGGDGLVEVDARLVGGWRVSAGCARRATSRGRSGGGGRCARRMCQVQVADLESGERRMNVVLLFVERWHRLLVMRPMMVMMMMIVIRQRLLLAGHSRRRGRGRGRIGRVG